MMNVLREIENEAAFLELMGDLKKAAVWPLSYFFNHENDIDEERAKLAHARYKLEIDRFAAYLHSANPDHYKRCGALFHALHTNPVVKTTEFDEDPDEVRNGFSRFPFAEQEKIAQALEFHRDYFDVFAPFDLCLRICNSYEAIPKIPDFKTVECVCHYVQNNTLTADSYYMIFKLLMM